MLNCARGSPSMPTADWIRPQLLILLALCLLFLLGLGGINLQYDLRLSLYQRGLTAERSGDPISAMTLYALLLDITPGNEDVQARLNILVSHPSLHSLNQVQTAAQAPPLRWLARAGRFDQMARLLDAAMVHIPAGKFLMGNNAGPRDQKPERTVYLDAFEMIGLRSPTHNTIVFFKKPAPWLRFTGQNLDFQQGPQIILLLVSAGSKLTNIAHGLTSGCRPRQKGRKPVAPREEPSTLGVIVGVLKEVTQDFCIKNRQSYKSMRLGCCLNTKTSTTIRDFEAWVPIRQEPAHMGYKTLSVMLQNGLQNGTTGAVTVSCLVQIHSGMVHPGTMPYAAADGWSRLGMK